jgi:hypothetical protein
LSDSQWAHSAVNTISAFQNDNRLTSEQSMASLMSIGETTTVSNHSKDLSKRSYLSALAGSDCQKENSRSALRFLLPALPQRS